eukprot:9095541-Pyramimonas_sp.AAC.1
MAVGICEFAWQRSECPRACRLHVAAAQRDREEEAAGHRARRRWLEREGPTLDGGRWLPGNARGGQDHVLRHVPLGLAEWPEVLAAGRLVHRGHLARSPPSLLRPTLEELAGAWAASHRVH